MKTDKWLSIITLVMIDIVLCILSATLSILMFGASWIMLSPSFYVIMMTVVLLTITVNALFKLYNRIWISIGITELLYIAIAVITTNTILYLISLIFQSGIYIRIHLLYFVFSFASIFTTRVFCRFRSHNTSYCDKSCIENKKILVVGAGEFGSMIIKELMTYPALGKPVSIVDDDYKKHGHYLRGIRVEGNRNSIPYICKEKGIDEIIIAIPSASREQIKGIANICASTKCKVKIIPGLSDFITENKDFTYKNVKDVQVEDLLGREPAQIDYRKLSTHIKGKRILVTGGGGSIGSEICRIVASFNPSKLLILDIYENTAYDLQMELLRKYPHLKVAIMIASVRNEKRIDEIMAETKPHMVFHAAAHKHVPICENNKGEAIRNNIFGTLNVVRAAHKYKINRFVLISTDKAVNPTNIMGATKRVCELIIKAYSSISETVFAAVRFGNVLGSNGSVITLFKRQIEEGGPVTVTHPDIIRYFMLIPEAAMLVLQAGCNARGGEIFILDMGSPVKIVDLARNLIKLSGKKPDIDIKIRYTGLRPGEKLYEELLMAEEQVSARMSDGIYIGTPEEIDYNILTAKLVDLKSCLEVNEDKAVAIVSELVPYYKSEKSMKKVININKEIQQMYKGLDEKDDILIVNH